MLRFSNERPQYRALMWCDRPRHGNTFVKRLAPTSCPRSQEARSAWNLNVLSITAGISVDKQDDHSVFGALARRWGPGTETNWVACRTPVPSGVGISMRNGTTRRVPA